MILEPDAYEPPVQYNNRPRLSHWDLGNLEVTADERDALKVIEWLMSHHSLQPKAIRAELDHMENYEDGSKETIDLSCLAALATLA